MKQTVRKFKNLAHLLIAIGAIKLYKSPAKKLKVIGVTGTDGKTTTSNLIYHILKNSGYKTALISTVGAVIDGKEYDTGYHVTTPSPFKIQKYLKIAESEKCTHAVIEVTSHALDQNRVYGVNFEIGVLTNVTREHLDYHKNYFKYLNTKLKLLKKSKIKIVNSNGEWIETVIKEVRENLITYSLDKKNKNDVSLKDLPFKVKTNLVGDFNLENILAAILVCQNLGVKDQDIENSISSYEAPEGRQQIVKNKKIGMIMIDFAHTPNSFAKILPVVKNQTEGHLIHIFGSAGKRDKSKRPEMGKISSKFSDVIILTQEDTRGEAVENINANIREGVDKKFIIKNEGYDFSKHSLYEIPDRKEAIKFAIQKAGIKDSILITGKGHEKSLNLGHGEIPWSDEDTVKEILNNYNAL